MENYFQLLSEFYTKYEKLLLIIATALITWFLNKALPAIKSYVSLFISLIGKKLGGRLAHKNILETYLNWLVYKTQDLNLTGVIGAEEKPKLEQIFISLRIVKEYDKLSKKEDTKDTEMTKSFFKTLIYGYNEYLNLFFLILFYIETLNHNVTTYRVNQKIVYLVQDLYGNYTTFLIEKDLKKLFHFF